MPIPGEILQKGGGSSNVVVNHTAAVAETWAFQNYPVPQSRRGKGGWNNDVNAVSRLKGADARTNDIIRKAQEKEYKTNREILDQHHAHPFQESTRYTRAQKSYLLDHLYTANTLNGKLDMTTLMWLMGGAAAIYILFIK
jgi:hypothetical protein